MARTKKRVLDDHRTASQQARCTERLVSKRRGIRGSARMLTADELAALPGPKLPCTRATESEEHTGEEVPAPAPRGMDLVWAALDDCDEEEAEEACKGLDSQQIVKLSAVTACSSSRFLWRGQIRGGGKDIMLSGTWVRKSFKTSFLDRVRAAYGQFVFIPIGRAQERAAPTEVGGHWDGPEALSAQGASAFAEVILKAECPAVAHRQGAVDLCAAYGLASALQQYGDTSAATAIASCAHTALASSDAFRHVTDYVVRAHAMNA